MATFPNTSGVYSVAPEISNESLDIWPGPGDAYRPQAASANFTQRLVSSPGQGISLDVSIEMVSDDGGPNCMHWSPASASPPASPCHWSCSNCPAESPLATPSNRNSKPPAIWSPGDHAADDGQGTRASAVAESGRGKTGLATSGSDARAGKDKPPSTDMRPSSPKQGVGVGASSSDVDPKCILSAIWVNAEKSRVSVTRTNQATEESYGLWCAEAGQDECGVDSRGTLPGLWMSDGEHIVTAQRSRTRQTEEVVMRIGGVGVAMGAAGKALSGMQILKTKAEPPLSSPSASNHPPPPQQQQQKQQEAECICGAPLIPCALQCGAGKRRDSSPPPAVGSKGDDVSCMRLPMHDALSTIWTLDGKQCIAIDGSHPPDASCPLVKAADGATARKAANNDDALSTIWTLDGEQSLSLNASTAACPLSCAAAAAPPLKKDDAGASRCTIWTLDGNPECTCPTKPGDGSASSCARRTLANKDSMSTVWSLDGKHGFALDHKQHGGPQASSDGVSPANECQCRVSSCCLPQTASATKKPPPALLSSGGPAKRAPTEDKKPAPSDVLSPPGKRLVDITSPNEGSPNVRPPDTKAPPRARHAAKKSPDMRPHLDLVSDVFPADRKSTDVRQLDVMLLPERDVPKCSITKLETREETFTFSSQREKVTVDVLPPRTCNESNCMVGGKPLCSMSAAAAAAALEKKQSGLSEQSADFPRDDCSLRSSGTSSIFRKEGPRCSISTLSSDRGNVFPERECGCPSTTERSRQLQQSISAVKNESRAHMSSSSTSAASNKSIASTEAANVDRFTLRTIKEVPYAVRADSSSGGVSDASSKWKVVAEFNINPNDDAKEKGANELLMRETPTPRCRGRSRSPDAPPPSAPAPQLPCSGGSGIMSSLECVHKKSPDRGSQFAARGKAAAPAADASDMSLSPLRPIKEGSNDKRSEPMAMIRRGGGCAASTKRNEVLTRSSKSSFSSSASDCKANALSTHTVVAAPSTSLVKADGGPQRAEQPLCSLSAPAPPEESDCDRFSVTIDLTIDNGGGQTPVRMVITDDGQRMAPLLPRIEQPYCSLTSYSSPNDAFEESYESKSNFSMCSELPSACAQMMRAALPSALLEPPPPAPPPLPCALSSAPKKKLCDHKRNRALDRGQAGARTVKDVRYPSPVVSKLNSLASGLKAHGACKHSHAHSHARHHHSSAAATAASTAKTKDATEDKALHKNKVQSLYRRHHSAAPPPLPEDPSNAALSLLGQRTNAHSRCRLSGEALEFSWSGEDELNPSPDWSPMKCCSSPHHFADEWSTRTPDDSSSVTSLEAKQCLTQGKEKKALATAAAAAAAAAAALKSSEAAPPPSPPPLCPRHSHVLPHKCSSPGAGGGGSRSCKEHSSSRSPSASRRQKQPQQPPSESAPAAQEAWSAGDTNDDEPISIKSRKSSFTSTESKPYFSSEEISQESCPMSSVHWRTKSSSSGSEDKKEVVSELVRIRPLHEGPLTLPPPDASVIGKCSMQQSLTPPPPPSLPSSLPSTPPLRRPAAPAAADWRALLPLNEDLHFMHEDDWRGRVFMDELSTETEPWPTMSTMTPRSSLRLAQAAALKSSSPSQETMKGEEDDEEEEELMSDGGAGHFCLLNDPVASPIALAAAVSAPAQTTAAAASSSSPADDLALALTTTGSHSSESVLETGRVLSTIWSSDGKTSNDSEQGRLLPSDECTEYGLHVAHRIREYSLRTRSLVQLQINDVLFRADTGQLEPSPSMELEPGANGGCAYQDDLYDTADEWGTTCFPYSARVAADRDTNCGGGGGKAPSHRDL